MKQYILSTIILLSSSYALANSSNDAFKNITSSVPVESFINNYLQALKNDEPDTFDSCSHLPSVIQKIDCLSYLSAKNNNQDNPSEPQLCDDIMDCERYGYFQNASLQTLNKPIQNSDAELIKINSQAREALEDIKNLDAESAIQKLQDILDHTSDSL